MIPLPAEQLRYMAHQFIVVCTDERKQTIVDSLGLNPINHARFVMYILTHCGGDARNNITFTFAMTSYYAAAAKTFPML